MSVDMWDIVGIWLGAICTLAIYSFLYKENPFYRVFEYMFTGMAIGYGIVIFWFSFMLPQWWQPLTGQEGHKEFNFLWLFPFFLGFLYYFIYSKKRAWLAKIVIGFSLGIGMGMTFQGVVTELMPQIAASFKSFNIVPMDNSVTIWESVTNIVFVLTLLCVMVYFFFSFEHEHPVIQRSATTGRWLLMVSFGAFFGSTVMARMSLLIERLQFLIEEWVKKSILFMG